MTVPGPILVQPNNHCCSLLWGHLRIDCSRCRTRIVQRVSYEGPST
jgi:hypothetical protein